MRKPRKSGWGSPKSENLPSDNVGNLWSGFCPEPTAPTERTCYHLDSTEPNLGEVFRPDSESMYTGTYEFAPGRETMVRTVEGFLLQQDGPNRPKRVVIGRPSLLRLFGRLAPTDPMDCGCCLPQNARPASLARRGRKVPLTERRLMEDPRHLLTRVCREHARWRESRNQRAGAERIPPLGGPQNQDRVARLQVRRRHPVKVPSFAGGASRLADRI